MPMKGEPGPRCHLSPKPHDLKIVTAYNEKNDQFWSWQMVVTEKFGYFLFPIISIRALEIFEESLR